MRNYHMAGQHRFNFILQLGAIHGSKNRIHHSGQGILGKRQGVQRLVQRNVGEILRGPTGPFTAPGPAVRRPQGTARSAQEEPRMRVFPLGAVLIDRRDLAEIPSGLNRRASDVWAGHTAAICASIEHYPVSENVRRTFDLSGT